jgi:hypothetical protein
VATLHSQLAAVPPGVNCPEAPQCPTLAELLPAGAQVVPVDAAGPATQQASPSSGLWFRGALVLLGAGLLVGAAGGAYLTASALR